MSDLINELEAQAQAGIAAYANGQVEEAETILKDVMGIDGSHVGALRTLGAIHFARGDHTGAEIYVLKALLFGGPEAALFLDAAEIAIQDERFVHARVFMNRFQGAESTEATLRQRAAEIAETLLEAS